MTKKKSYLTFTDQFCGAGGSSQGVRAAARRLPGLEVAVAMNHWKLAIDTHSTNFQDTKHFCADIQNSDPRWYPSTDVLITSPECTNHSLAKGVKRKFQSQMDLFNQAQDVAAMKSRATMWDVPRFAEAHNYRIIIVENVVDARYWVLWNSWLHAMHTLGYEHKCVYANSMFFHPTPQSRDRMYVVFWKKGNPAPNLEHSPTAHCAHCGKDVPARQSWKRGEKQWGKYKQQYVYRCPGCHHELTPYYHAAFNCIDWGIKSQRIGDRKAPLSPKTVERIEAGLKKYGNRVFLATTRYSGGVDSRLRLAGEALPTQTGDYSHGVCIPMVIETGHSQADTKAKESLYPIFTQTTAQTLGIAIPMMVANYTPGWTRPITEHGGTITTSDSHALLQPPMIVNNFGTNTASSSMKRLGCITTGGINYGVLTTRAMNAFLANYYSSGHNVNSVVEQGATVTTVERTALVEPSENLRIEDCHYRMLVPKEIQSAMAFEDDYVVLGNGREKVKQLGNAVTPPVMEWLVGRCVETLN